MSRRQFLISVSAFAVGVAMGLFPNTAVAKPQDSKPETRRELRISRVVEDESSINPWIQNKEPIVGFEARDGIYITRTSEYAIPAGNYPVQNSGEFTGKPYKALPELGTWKKVFEVTVPDNDNSQKTTTSFYILDGQKGLPEIPVNAQVRQYERVLANSTLGYYAETANHEGYNPSNKGASGSGNLYFLERNPDGGFDVPKTPAQRFVIRGSSLEAYFSGGAHDAWLAEQPLPESIFSVGQPAVMPKGLESRTWADYRFPRTPILWAQLKVRQ